MRNAVRSLHRYYACLVAQAALEPVADDNAERWEAAMEQGGPLPDLGDLFLAVTSAGVPILSPLPIAGYLRQCMRDRRVPDPQRIVQAIAHAQAELDPGNMFKTCSCPGRRPLIGLPSRPPLPI